ncbi:MAG TPA: phage tail tape measure protein, partial [Aliiroseovarius sp.]|nr:phage tail tape measure protein [Aliiroseovarius sp.]
PMRGGLGLMGEAGPEAIMPLARGPDGRLGVRGGGGRPVNITMNISTPDVEGFRRSQGQIATQMARAIARGQRNL